MMIRYFFLLFVTASILVFTSSCAQPITLEDGAAPDPRLTAGVDSRNLDQRPRRTPIEVGEPVPRLYLQDQFGRDISTRELTLGGDALLIFYPGYQSPEARPVYKWVAQNQNPLSNHLEILLVSQDSIADNHQTAIDEGLRLAILSDPSLWCTRSFGLAKIKPNAKLDSTWSVLIGKEDKVLGIRDGFFDHIEILTTLNHRPSGKQDNRAVDLLFRD